ncbi:MAG: FISUMP domain-containing protein [Fibrobacterota bacterium]
MNTTFSRIESSRHLALALLLAWAVASMSCSSKPGSSVAPEPLTTNFNLNLTSLIEANQRNPDSIVAEIKMDGGAAKTIVVDPAQISQSGLIQIPVDALEGAKIEVAYKVWMGAVIVGTGTVKWVSGEPLTVPRPDLAPTISFEGLVSKELVLRRGAKIWLHTRSTDPEGALSTVFVDLDDDGKFDDSLTPPKGGDSLQVSWSKVGSYRVTAWLRDRAGLTAKDTLRVRVIAAAQVSLSSDTLVSIGDSIDLQVRLDLDDSAQREGLRLVWSGIGATPQTTGPVEFLRTSLSDSGVFTVRIEAIDEIGVASTDSVRVTVVQDEPRFDLSRIPEQVELGTVVLLPVGISQRFGTIERWSIDFDGDTASEWDSSMIGPPAAISHLFARSGSFNVITAAIDDDGNRVVASKSVWVGSSLNSQVLRRTSPPDTTVSIHDSAEIRFVRNFPPGTESNARLEWQVDDEPVQSQAIALNKRFAWSQEAVHLVSWRVVMPSGSTAWDTVRVQVVLGAPVLQQIKTLGSGVSQPIYFSAKVDPVFGSISRTRWDFGNDGIWDDSVVDPATQVKHIFSTSTTTDIHFQATDDDGNTIDTLFPFSPTNAAPAFGLAAFAESSVGVGLPVALRATFTDPDGAADLATLSVDWDGDGSWDTVRNATGLGSDEIRHSWSTSGSKTAYLLLTDHSGATALDSATIVVRTHAPRIVSLLASAGRDTVRMGDTLWFVATIADSSNPPDLDSIRWRRDDMTDSVVSLRGLSAGTTRIPVASNVVGTHSVTAVVHDLVGNIDTASATWTVKEAPPLVVARLRDSILIARDTVTVTLDSLRPGRLGGSVSRVDWSFKGGETWTTVPSPTAGKPVLLTLPADGDPNWRIVVRATQDNGETDFDTLSAELLSSFVDKRDGAIYPYITVGTTTWMARNLSWQPSIDDSVTSTCVGGGNCDARGRLYSVPVPLPNQPASTDAGRSISVCPDGWRLPSDLEFNELIETGRAMLPTLSYAQILRARTGWTNPLPSQPDPLRFAALPTLAYAAEPFTAWWTYSQQSIPDPNSPYPNNMNQSIRDLGTDDLTPRNKYWSTAGASVRCVRLKEIIIDSSWKPAAPDWDSAWMPILELRGLVPEPSVSVTIRATIQGQSVQTIMTPNGHEIPWTKLPQLPFVGIGTFPVTLEVVQGAVGYTESIDLVVTAVE